MLLEPCLPALPEVPSSPPFANGDSDSLSSDSDLDVTSSWRAMHTDSEYSGWMSADEDQKAGERSSAEAWPTALDLQVPPGARVVAVTGPNTGVLVLIQLLRTGRGSCGCGRPDRTCGLMASKFPWQASTDLHASQILQGSGRSLFLRRRSV